MKRVVLDNTKEDFTLIIPDDCLTCLFEIVKENYLKQPDDYAKDNPPDLYDDKWEIWEDTIGDLISCSLVCKRWNRMMENLKHEFECPPKVLLFPKSMIKCLKSLEIKHALWKTPLIEKNPFKKKIVFRYGMNWAMVNNFLDKMNATQLLTLIDEFSNELNVTYLAYRYDNTDLMDNTEFMYSCTSENDEKHNQWRCLLFYLEHYYTLIDNWIKKFNVVRGW